MVDSGEVLALLIAIILHNWAESLSIGANLAQRHIGEKKMCKLVILMLFYSMVQPLGVGIGWAIL